MAGVRIGTEAGLFRMEPGEKPQREEGPPSIAHLTRAGDTTFAVTREGALWRKTGSGPWQLISERPVTDEIWTLGADPRIEGRLYLGLSPAQFYRSDDGGESWRPCDSLRQIPGYETWTFPPPPHIAHVRSIAFDPERAGAVYIGVEEGGVFRSPDGGETWESCNEGLFWDVHTVVPAPASGRLYATTGRGFHRSDDWGLHWRHITTGLDRSYTVPCVMSPQNSDRLYTAAASAPPNRWREAGADVGLYRSDDGGEHWERLARDLPALTIMARNMATDDEGGVYAAAGGSLFASENVGETWRLAAGDMPPIRALVAL